MHCQMYYKLCYIHGLTVYGLQVEQLFNLFDLELYSPVNTAKVMSNHYLTYPHFS